MATASNDVSYQATGRRRWLLRTMLLVLVGGLCVAIVYAIWGSGDSSWMVQGELPTNVGIDQKLTTQVPLDIRLQDETGIEVRLRDLIDDKPVILNLVYYECPMLCGMTMDGQVRSLAGLTLDAGKDFTALTVSFDPREDHMLAAAAKRTALKRYGRADADRGWRFLTGDESETRRLADAVGFRYKFDSATGQYAHAAGLIVLTPAGKVSRYLYGVEFPPRDLRLALVEASGGTIGSPTDQVLLLCYHYDPTTGRYGLAIMSMLRLAGVATVICLSTAIIVMIRHDRRLRDDSLEPTQEAT